MVDPVFTLYDQFDVPISSGNPITLGLVPAGVVGISFSVWMWNDRGGILGSITATAPRISVVPVPDSLGVLLTGTDFNGNVSMVEACSCRASGTFAQNQSGYTPITPQAALITASIPKNCAREILIRLNVPFDAPALQPLKHFALQIDW